MRQPLEVIGGRSLYQSVISKEVPVCSGGKTEVDFPVKDSYFLYGPGVEPTYIYVSQEAASNYAKYLAGGGE